MDYRTITRLRRIAVDAREQRVKALISPDDLAALLDIACDHLDQELAR